MAAFFLDTSALVKRYASETGTAWVKALIDPAAGNRIYVARITEVETIAALARKLRGNHITPSDAATATSTLEDEIKNVFRVVEVSINTFAVAKALARRHFLRGYDAVQLAAASEAQATRAAFGFDPLTLITGDKDLLAAGSAEGLDVDDPNNH